MALVKFGIPHGLFISDARISPQAKREFLNDYPQLELEFLDGEELLAEVLSNAPLRAIWFDGGRLGAINSRVTFPVLIRRHADDRPVLPLRHAALQEAVLAVVREEASQRGLAAEARESTSERAAFERYRWPTRLTMEEGALSELRVTEVGFKGGMALHELEPLAETLAQKLAAVVGSVLQAATVLVGRAFVTPLEGDDAGLRTLTDAPRAAAVGVGGTSAPEARWFQPDPAGKWDGTCDARVTESNWVRLYHAGMDAAAACEVVTPAAAFDAVRRQTTRLGWSRSVFALMPSSEEWPHTDIPEPDDRIAWTFEPGRVLCGWFHPLTGGVPIAIPADHGDEGPRFPRVDENAADGSLADVRARLGALPDATLVDPDRARHMLALVSRDPLEADDAPTTFGTADVLAAFDGLASPIDPASRRGELAIAWRTGEEAETAIGEVGAALAQALDGVASLEAFDEFVALTVQMSALPPQMSTPAWLHQLAEITEPILAKLDRELQLAGVSCSRATAAFWWKAHYVRLGVPWHASDKVFMWRMGATGPEPVKVTREEIEDASRPFGGTQAPED